MKNKILLLIALIIFATLPILFNFSANAAHIYYLALMLIMPIATMQIQAAQ